MPPDPEQILTVAQMRAAEDALIARGIGVDELMQRAGQGTADWVWRIAGHHKVTVLCGPGNNGGDGYVIAEALRARGGKVAVIAATDPRTDAARNARGLYRGEFLPLDADPHGEVLVDCLFGSGLTRPLDDIHVTLLTRLATSHRYAIAVDVPSGVESDTGALLNEGLPRFDLTIALGAWKLAHFLMPASVTVGAIRLIDIGVVPVLGAATVLARPCFAAPAADAHKYRRGLLAVVGGEMPGAALLAARASQGAGAGYVKLLVERLSTVPHDLVVDSRHLADALGDERIGALLVGPGLGRHAEARERLVLALVAQKPTVLDADALVLLGERLLHEHKASLVATPHEGELKALEDAFDCDGRGAKSDRVRALAVASGMVVVAKGPDTVIAAPDGRLVCAPRASSWLATAGTGDVLAGVIASRLAAGGDSFASACEGVWLHGEAARLAGTAFTASGLAEHVAPAFAAAL